MSERTQKLNMTFGMESDEFNAIATKAFCHCVNQMAVTLHHKNHHQYAIYINLVSGAPLTQ
jgi:hypothetical protein